MALWLGERKREVVAELGASAAHLERVEQLAWARGDRDFAERVHEVWKLVVREADWVEGGGGVVLDG